MSDFLGVGGEVHQLGYYVTDIPNTTINYTNSDNTNNNNNTNYISGMNKQIMNKMADFDKLKITNLKIHSTRNYEIVRVSTDDYVYSDRTLRWLHLPCILRNRTCIRTPCDDKMVRVKSLLQFIVSEECLVLILIDGVKTPKWLGEDGFYKTGERE